MLHMILQYLIFFSCKPEEFDLGISPRNSVITRDEFYLRGPIRMIRQLYNYQTFALLFSILSMTSCPCTPWVPILFLSSGWPAYLILPFCLNLSCM